MWPWRVTTYVKVTWPWRTRSRVNATVLAYIALRFPRKQKVHRCSLSTTRDRNWCWVTSDSVRIAGLPGVKSLPHLYLTPTRSFDPRFCGFSIFSTTSEHPSQKHLRWGCRPPPPHLCSNNSSTDFIIIWNILNVKSFEWINQILSYISLWSLVNLYVLYIDIILYQIVFCIISLHLPPVSCLPILLWAPLLSSSYHDPPTTHLPPIISRAFS